MRTAHSSPYGGLPDRDPLDRDPPEGTWDQAARQEVSSYRDSWEQNDQYTILKILPCATLRLRAVISVLSHVWQTNWFDDYCFHAKLIRNDKKRKHVGTQQQWSFLELTNVFAPRSFPMFTKTWAPTTVDYQLCGRLLENAVSHPTRRTFTSDLCANYFL